MFLADSVGSSSSVALTPPKMRTTVGFRHTPESYAEALSLLGPEPKRYSDEFWEWRSRRDALGAEPGEGVQVERVLYRGGRALVSTQSMYRVVEVPSGRILYEMQDFDHTTSTLSIINRYRSSSNAPYAIGVAYELVYAMEQSQGLVSWSDISVTPAPEDACSCCGTTECGRTGSLWVSPSNFVQGKKCQERERIRLAATVEKLRNESKLMGSVVTFETSEVIDDRYEWQFPPDMADYVESLGEAEIEWRRRELDSVCSPELSKA